MNLKFELNEYEKLRQPVVDYINKKGFNFDQISQFCATSGFSLIATYSFIAEEFPQYREDSLGKVKMLKEFYGYEV